MFLLTSTSGLNYSIKKFAQLLKWNIAVFFVQHTIFLGVQAKSLLDTI